MAGIVPVSVAGGAAERAVLIVDPTSPNALRVANHYRAARDLPDACVVYLDPGPASWAQFASTTSDAFLGALANLGIEAQVDFVVLAPNGEFAVAAPGLVADGCFPVNRFAITTPFTMVREEATISAGGVSSLVPNGYSRAADDALAFDAQTTWLAGLPNAAGKRYFLGASLGYDGPLGNTVDEILAMIDRSVASDGTLPTATSYFMQTTDPFRSPPRHPFFPAAVSAITALGGLAQHLFADLPLGANDCVGVMTGLADPPIDSANLTLVPGSFADHLTSYAATYDSSSQTKMSRWIAKGASGTSGAVEEPCNYAQKFPHPRLHVFYRQGLALGEAWLRSMAAAPFQSLFTGDPLTRPFARIPTVSIAGLPPGPASGLVVLTASGTTTQPGASVASFELHVDGRLHSKKPAGASFVLDTTALADGSHELRVLGVDSTPVATTGRAIAALETSNHGRTAALSAPVASGDLSTRFDLQATAGGGAVSELRLVHGTRVVASAASAPATLSVFGRTLGAGSVRLRLEADFADGRRALSAPVVLAVADAAAAPGPAAPLASSYTRRARNDQVAIVELASTSDATLASTTWTVLSGPVQSQVIGGAGSPYRLLRPNPGAAGADALTFRCDTPAGTSSVATVTVVWEAPVACPPPASYCTSAPNSAGAGAFLAAFGSPSLGANDLVLNAFGLPPDKTGIVLYSRSTASVPLGDGTRCVGAPIYRVGTVQSDAFGDVVRPIDWTTAPYVSGAGAVSAGTTGYFQIWYRDPGFGSGTNLTDGLAVTACP